MPNGHFSFAEWQALQKGVGASAETYLGLRENLEGSETSRAFNDEGFFQREGDSLFADRARVANAETGRALEAVRARRALSGLGSSIGEKDIGAVGAAGTGRVSALRAEFTAGAERKRAENDARFLSLQGQVDAAKANVFTQQQALARRLGEVGYTDEIWYQPPDESSEQFFEEEGLDYSDRARENLSRQYEQQDKDLAGRQGLDLYNRGSRVDDMSGWMWAPWAGRWIRKDYAGSYGGGS